MKMNKEMKWSGLTERVGEQFDGERLSQKKPIRLVAKSFKHPFFK